MNDCITCTWYLDGYCHNPDCYSEEEWSKNQLTEVEPDDGCTLWEAD